MNKKLLLISLLVAGIASSTFVFAACNNTPSTDNPSTDDPSTEDPGVEQPEDTVYTITFNTNGGSAVSPVDVTAGQSVDLDNYITENNGDAYFYGWYLDSELIERAPAQFSPTSDVTLYAAWSEELVYTLTFDSCGGSAVAAQEYTDNEYLAAPSAPTRTGYRFDGWYWDNQYSKEFIFEGNTMIADNITVYAKWVRVSTLTFVTNGGNAIDPVEVEEGETAVAPEDPVYEGYVFEGWFADEDLTTPFEFTALEGDATAYAKWRELQTGISLTLDPNSPVASIEIDSSSITVNEGDSLQVSAVQTFEQALNAELGATEGNIFNFAYWSFDEAGNLSVGSAAPYVEGGSDTLYAQWSLSAAYCAVTFTGGTSGTLTLYIPKMQQATAQMIESVAAYYGESVASFVAQDGSVYDLSSSTFERNITLSPVVADDFSFELNASGYAVTAYNGSATEVVVPSTYNGLPVTAIADRAFANNTAITSVTISSGVKSIGAGAFSGCTALAEFVGGEYLTSVGEDAFEDTQVGTRLASGLVYLDGQHRIIIGFQGSSASITIDSSVTVIADGAFADSTSLTTVTLASGCRVSSIPARAFYGCTSLSTVNFNGSAIVSIGDSAFEGCTSLESITLPATVASVGGHAFSGCSDLAEVSLSGVTTLGEYAFANSGLTSVDLTGVSLSVIPANAFAGCAALTSVVLPEITSQIGDSAFENCTLLTTVTVNAPDGSRVEAIGENAFAGCIALRTVIIFSGDINGEFTTIGAGAFDNCADDLVIFVSGGAPSYDRTSDWYDSASDEMKSYTEIYAEINDGLTFLEAEFVAPVIRVPSKAIMFKQSEMTASEDLLTLILASGVTATDNMTAAQDIVFSISSVRHLTTDSPTADESEDGMEGYEVVGQNGLYDLTENGVYRVVIRATDRFGNSSINTIEIAIVD